MKNCNMHSKILLFHKFVITAKGIFNESLKGNSNGKNTRNQH